MKALIFACVLLVCVPVAEAGLVFHFELTPGPRAEVRAQARAMLRAQRVEVRAPVRVYRRSAPVRTYRYEYRSWSR